MPTKLTLRLDSNLIDQAKSYAVQQDRSLSQLVADYFAHLTLEPHIDGKARGRAALARPASGPITSALRGSLRQSAGGAAAASISRDGYRDHLAKKYL